MRTKICACYIVVPILSCAVSVMGQETGGPTQATRAIDEGALWEDMEVLSSLLQTTVRQLYGQRSGPMFGTGVISDAGIVGHIIFEEKNKLFTPRTEQGSSESRFKKPHSTYLPGYGIVLQMDLPPLRSAAEATEADDPIVCPFASKTPWERERERVRGAWRIQNCQGCHEESFQGSNSPLLPTWVGQGRYSAVLGHQPSRADRAPTRDQLVDQLMKLLAENGHQVRELEPEETVAIAMTFRDQTRSPTRYSYVPDAAQQYSRPNAQYGATLGVQVQPSSADPYAQPQAAQVKQQPAAVTNRNRTSGDPHPFVASNWPIPFKSSRDEDEGDLYLRQSNYKKAIEAFEKALIALERAFQQTVNPGSAAGPTSALPFLAGIDEQSRPHHARRLLQKLSQAHIGDGDVKGARAALDRLERLKSQPKKSDPAASQEQTLAGLPARLVIRIAKAALDDVAAKNISIKQFKEAVKVDFFEPKVVVDKTKSGLGGPRPTPKPRGRVKN